MAGVAAYGATLQIGTGTTGTALIANITRIGGPGMSTEIIDITAHDSGGSYREMAPTFLSYGEVTFDLNWVPTTATGHGTTAATGLLDIWYDKTLQPFILSLPQGTASKTTLTFSGYVTSFQPDAPFDDKLSASVTITVSGSTGWGTAAA